MYITTQFCDGIAVINVVGKLDFQTHLTLKSKCRELVCDLGYRKILIDVGGIRGIDSTGLGLMAQLANLLRPLNGDVRLAGTLEPEVAEAFELCGLLKVLEIYPNVETGIKKFQL